VTFRPSDLIRLGDVEHRSRELVGLAAVEGNGQRELLYLAGLKLTDARQLARRFAWSGILVPEDRSNEADSGDVARGKPGAWTERILADPTCADRLGAVRRHAARLIDSYGTALRD
jgi:hypothetical protein